MISLRCSSLDRINACPASATPPAVRIDSSDDAALMGNAIHELLSAHIDGREKDLGEVAKRWGVDLEELARLFSIAKSLWGRVKSHFPNAITEHAFEPATIGGIALTGHGDVISIADDGGTVYLLDFKSGWGDGDHQHQLRGYGLLALGELPMADKVTACVLKIRHGDLETFEWTRDELTAWGEDLARRVESERELYRPSVPACGYCPRAHECPARAAYLRSAISVMEGVTGKTAMVRTPGDIGDVADFVEPPALTPQKVADVVEFARTLAKMCDAAIDLAKAEVRLAGGRIVAPDGRELVLSDVPRTEIDFAAGEGVLRAHLGDDIAKVLKVGKTAAEDAVKAKAARGQKGKVAERMLYELDQAGALKVTSSPKLDLKRPKAIAAAE